MLDSIARNVRMHHLFSFFISYTFFYYALFQLFPYFLFPDDCSNTASAGDDILGMYNNGSTAAYDAEVRLELLELYSIKIEFVREGVDR